MSKPFDAWVSYDSEVVDLKTTTLRDFITVPIVARNGADQPGTILLTGDGTGNTCMGEVIFIQDQLVTILFDDDTKSWKKS